MEILDSLFISIFGMSVVFAVLISLILLINLQSLFLQFYHRKRQLENTSKIAPKELEPVAARQINHQSTRPELKLYNIDDKTAAIVMAIVCAEIGSPPETLIFKSIRMIDNPSN